MEANCQPTCTPTKNLTGLSGPPNEHEDPYPSLSDYHDYEPNLEFDDTELQNATGEARE
ncbi:hypothetical protein LSTR_LSTR012378 [Laodelphax striatellus]|uniref:Uncharacterized protein n=1 Tax=Laodelphax striatellus TaxID=195883 RepID=A0A482WNU3_LAOST|nr:hypothetical protein LSTR_LSTR012378 [Laodelphax striatellus]